MDFSKLTLGELLSHKNNTIQRNAISIYKTLIALDKKVNKYEPRYCKSGMHDNNKMACVC